MKDDHSKLSSEQHKILRESPWGQSATRADRDGSGQGQRKAPRWDDCLVPSNDLAVVSIDDEGQAYQVTVPAGDSPIRLSTIAGSSA